MRPRELLLALWVLAQLTGAGSEVSVTWNSSRPTQNPWGNVTLGDGGTTNLSESAGEGGSTNIIVAVVFVGLVMTMMSVAIYFALKRRGCERRNWEKRTTEDGLRHNAVKRLY